MSVQRDDNTVAWRGQDVLCSAHQSDREKWTTIPNVWSLFSTPEWRINLQDGFVWLNPFSVLSPAESLPSRDVSLHLCCSCQFLQYHPPPPLSSLPQPWVFSHAPTECLLLALIRCFIAITFFCRGDYAVVHQERKPHLSWWYTKMFKKGEQTKGPWEGHAIYTIFATSHRNTVITLSSERLYIENKNIIINLSSGMKQRGEVLCRTICTSVLTVNCCI